MKIAAEIAENREYKGFVIEPWYGYFAPHPNRLIFIASFIVHKEGFACGFAFAISGLSALTKQIPDQELLEMTQEIINDHIDRGAMGNLAELTFEFQSGQFIEVEGPSWWIKSRG